MRRQQARQWELMERGISDCLPQQRQYPPSRWTLARPPQHAQLQCLSGTPARRVQPRSFSRSLGRILAFATAVCLSSFAQLPPRNTASADSAIVIDTHADTPMRITDENFDLA